MKGGKMLKVTKDTIGLNIQAVESSTGQMIQFFQQMNGMEEEGEERRFVKLKRLKKKQFLDNFEAISRNNIQIDY